MVSKKELAARYDICDNTVYETIKACGMDTSKRDYDEEEIQERFDVARKMFNAGKKGKEIERYFALKDASQRTKAQGSAYADTPYDEVSPEYGLKQQIGKEVAGAMQEIVSATVRELVPYIPLMASKALKSLVESGDVKEAFHKYQQHVDTLPSLLYEDAMAALPGSEAEYEVAYEDESPPEQKRKVSRAKRVKLANNSDSDGGNKEGEESLGNVVEEQEGTHASGEE